MKFEKISKEQYDKDFEEGICLYVNNERKYVSYEDIKLPKRATKGSAGYDIFATRDILLGPGETVKFPTGIRVELDDDKFLAIYPRSGLGFRYRLMLNNTVGIIDSDYFYSDNEGHIWVKLTLPEETKDIVEIHKGEAVCQGIIQQYFKVDNDDTDEIRNGGFGSTSK